MKAFWDIVLKPKAPIYQIAQILDYQQSPSSNAPFWMLGILIPITQYIPFKTSCIKAKVQHVAWSAAFYLTKKNNNNK